MSGLVNIVEDLDIERINLGINRFICFMYDLLDIMFPLVISFGVFDG